MKVKADRKRDLGIDEFIIQCDNEIYDGMTVYQIRCGKRVLTEQRAFLLYDYNVAKYIDMEKSHYNAWILNSGGEIESKFLFFTSKKKAEEMLDKIIAEAVLKKLSGKSSIWNIG
jgi:hypothetical protein